MTQTIPTTADIASRALLNSPMMLQTGHTHSTSQIVCVLYPLTIPFHWPPNNEVAPVSLSTELFTDQNQRPPPGKTKLWLHTTLVCVITSCSDTSILV